MSTRLLITFFLFLTFGFFANAYDFMVDGIAYNVTSDSTVEVTYTDNSYWNGDHINYPSLPETLAIPSIAENDGITYSVTSIGEQAFTHCDRLRSLTFGANVKSIGNFAFYHCTSLTNITLGDSIKTIGNYAFKCCQALADISFGNNITSIGNYAFQQCLGLTNVSIPNSVSSLGKGVFNYCENLNTIVLPDNITIIPAELFERCTNLTSFDIPNTVSEIGESAFAFTGLTSISFPDSLTKLGKDAFSNCKITAVYIPKTITEIIDNPFRNDCLSVSPYNDDVITMYNDVSTIVVDQGNPVYDSRDNCNAIIHTASNKLLTGCKNTTIPHTVKTIGNNAFAYCGITSINIPNSVVTIGGGAFKGCIFLDSLNLGNSVQSIGKEAFSANAIKSLTTPASLKTIVSGAFSNCQSLTDVDLSRSTRLHSVSDKLFYYCSNLSTIKLPNSVSDIGHDAFSNTAWDASLPDGLNYASLVAYRYKGVMPSNTHIDIVEGTKGIADDCFADCDSLVSISLPNSLLFIGEEAFSYCKNLASIIIPDNVTNIEKYAFVHCENLSSAVLGKSLKNIRRHAFQYCKQLMQIRSKIVDVNSVQVEEYSFYRVPTKCVLKVPIGTVEDYRNTYPWRNFTNIEEWVDDVVGDVNADGAADGLDLNTIINIVLGKDDSNYDGRADMDGNGSVDGDDINQMINILLGK